MLILSLCTTHDAAVTIIKDGVVLLNCELERYSRVKADYGYSPEFVKMCLASLGLTINDVDVVCLDPIHEMYDDEHSQNQLLGLKEIGRVRVPGLDNVRQLKINILGAEKPGLILHHHLGHAASAYYTSPFDEAAVLTLDGWGDGVSLTVWHAAQNQMKPLFSTDLNRENNWAAVWEGFSKNNYGFNRQVPGRSQNAIPTEGPGKLMALAAYGKPNPRVSAELKLSLQFHTNADPSRLGGIPNPFPNYYHSEDLSDSHSEKAKDVAFALQRYTEEYIYTAFVLTADVLKAHGYQTENLCFSGGVALNCIASTRAVRMSPFKKIHVPPFPNDGGLAIGWGLAAAFMMNKANRRMYHFVPYNGPRYGKDRILDALTRARDEGAPIAFEQTTLPEVADLIVNGNIIAMWRNGSESGPRALGHRSIMARTDLKDLRERMNVHKKREWYRPFAPIVLAPRAHDLLVDVPTYSRYMTTSAKVAPEWRERMSGVLHIDDTTRPQVLEREAEPFIFDLVSQIDQKIGIPAVMNTSFNIQEPIVETPENAIQSFLKLQLPYLVLDDVLVKRR